ncbi:MAG: TIGR04222 domain-containing membrane protein [Leptospirales bacterium]|nr:TIGR04222 domain-containing membrane protein [Leptospirales bacterium]
MNPFDLAGPQFLIFYALGILVLFGALYLLRRFLEPSDLSGIRVTDPYEIACLRGGTNEVLRIACVKLKDRGVLESEGKQIRAAQGWSTNALDPLEDQIATNFASSSEASSIFKLTHHADHVARSLESKGLIPDEDMRMRRFMIKLAVMVTIGGVAVVRIFQALSHGRVNFIFLIVLALVGLFLIWRYDPRRTPAGDRVLAGIKRLLTRLRYTRVKPGGGNDALLLAAAFGLAALPSEYSYAREWFPKSDSTWSSSSGASTGSGCGSSCGSSGDSGGDSGGSSGCGGCGGGGCGGGCGG